MRYMFPVKSHILISLLISFLGISLLTSELNGQYVPVTHRNASAGELPVSEPGSYSIETMRKVISKNGTVRVVQPEYYIDGDVKTVLSPYTVLYGNNKVVVELEKETEIDLIVK